MSDCDKLIDLSGSEWRWLNGYIQFLSNEPICRMTPDRVDLFKEAFGDSVGLIVSSRQVHEHGKPLWFISENGFAIVGDVGVKR